VNGRFPIPANAKTLNRRNFPATGRPSEVALVQLGQRFRKIKPIRFKLLVYFGRPAVAGMVVRHAHRMDRDRYLDQDIGASLSP
jgi:hypothetical protein